MITKIIDSIQTVKVIDYALSFKKPVIQFKFVVKHNGLIPVCHCMHLYISDLDGTLLRSNTLISEWARRQLCELIESGTMFSIATGRSIVSSREILRGLPIRIPIIGGNGAYISNFESGLHYQLLSIPHAVVAEVLAMLRGLGYHPFVTTYAEEKDFLLYSGAGNPGEKWYLEDRLESNRQYIVHNPSFDGLKNHEVISISVSHTEEALTSLCGMLESVFPGMLQVHVFEDTHTPGWNWMTIHDSKASKGHAAAILAEQLNIDRDNVTVFGDNLNDLSMFRWAGRAVAVQNARPAVKEIATHLIGSHEDDSVVKFILEQERKVVIC